MQTSRYSRSWVHARLNNDFALFFQIAAGVKVRKTEKPGEAQYAAEIIFFKSFFLDVSMFSLKIHDNLSS